MVVLSGKKEAWENLIVCYKYLKEGCSEVGVDLLYHISSKRMKGNGLMLCQERFRLDIRKRNSLKEQFSIEIGCRGRWCSQYPWNVQEVSGCVWGYGLGVIVAVMG